jgi:hypothetical protein
MMMGARAATAGIDQHHVLKLALAARQDAGALVHVRRIEQVEHRHLLRGQHAVHGVEAEPALAVQKIRNVTLLDADLLGQLQTRQRTVFDPLDQRPAQILLQGVEFHNVEIYSKKKYISASLITVRE